MSKLETKTDTLTTDKTTVITAPAKTPKPKKFTAAEALIAYFNDYDWDPSLKRKKSFTQELLNADA